MKLRNRINLYTVVLFIGILLVINLCIYYLFSRLLIDSEMRQNHEEAERIIQGINKSIEQVDSADLVRAYVPVDGMIRIVKKDQTSSLTVTSPSQQSLSEIDTHFYREEINEQIQYNHQSYSVVSIPIIWSDGEVANLQVIESIHEVVDKLHILTIVLFIVTLIAMIPVIIASRVLSNLITTPITSMIDTMIEIRESGEHKKIEMHRKAKDELDDMANTFNHMIDSLKTNADKQEQFVSNASHELKTPLTVIESYASLLKRRGKIDSTLFDESVEAIHSEAIRMREMTEQLLLLAQPNEKWITDFETVNLTALVQQSVISFQKAFNRSIHLHVEAELSVRTDKQKLNQLLYIFLDNARKYSDSEKPITVTIELNKDTASILIFDQGMGIPKEDLSKVFDRFYRVDRARSRKTGGTGLGLSLAKELADAIGVKIELDSLEGVGTTVKILFP